MLVYSQDDSSDIEDRFPARMDISLNEHTIVQGNHPRVSFSPDSLSKLKDTNDDLVIRYRRRSPSTDEETIHQVKEVPQYFTDISDPFVEWEIEYRVEHGRWSDQVLLEKLYFGLLFGRSGYPNHYFVGDENHGTEPAYKRKLERAYGWSYNVFWRVVDVCALEGIFCIDEKIRKIVLPSFDLAGTLTEAIQYLTDLEVLNLQGNPPAGFAVCFLSICREVLNWSCDVPIILSRHETGNSIKGTIPSTFGKLTNLKVLILSGNSFSGSPPNFSAFTKLEVLLG